MNPRNELTRMCCVLFGREAGKEKADSVIAQLAARGVALSTVYSVAYWGPYSALRKLSLKSKTHCPEYTEVRTVRFDTDLNIVSDETEKKPNELGFGQRL